MATQNVRIVAYLPPSYRQKLREYMKEQSLTESAAIVKIVKQFFDGERSSNNTKTTLEASSAVSVSSVGEQLAMSQTIASVKAEVAQLQQRLSVLEQVVASGVKKGRTHSIVNRPLPTLPPQNGAELARRFGVNPSSIEEAIEKGEDYFKDWSQRRDPAKKAWQKRGELYHTIPD